MGLVYDIFQIQTWGLTPAQICFLRNEAGAATGSINNVRGELAVLSTVAGGGELASEIQGRAALTIAAIIRPSCGDLPAICRTAMWRLRPVMQAMGWGLGGAFAGLTVRTPHYGRKRASLPIVNFPEPLALISRYARLCRKWTNNWCSR